MLLLCALQRGGAIAWAVVIAVRTFHYIAPDPMADGFWNNLPLLLMLSILNFTGLQSCRWNLPTHPWTISLLLLPGMVPLDTFISIIPTLIFIFCGLSRQIYGGIGLGVVAVAVISMFALSNVSGVFW